MNQIQNYFVKIKDFRKKQKMLYEKREYDFKSISPEDIITSLEKQLKIYEHKIKRLEADNKKLKDILFIPEKPERSKKKRGD